MPTDLAHRQQTHFVLWRPAVTAPGPKLIIGRFQAGNPPQLASARELVLQADPVHPDLWTILASACGLTDGAVYLYWFEIGDSDARTCANFSAN